MFEDGYVCLSLKPQTTILQITLYDFKSLNWDRIDVFPIFGVEFSGVSKFCLVKTTWNPKQPVLMDVW